MKLASGGDPTYAFNIRFTGEEVHGTSECSPWPAPCSQLGAGGGGLFLESVSIPGHFSLRHRNQDWPQSHQPVQALQPQPPGICPSLGGNQRLPGTSAQHHLGSGTAPLISAEGQP